MSWKTGTKEEQRAYLIEQVIKRGVAQNKVCQELGVKRRTAYKWLQRYTQGGSAALRDQSRRPLRQGRQLDSEWVEHLARLRSKHPSWGAKKLWIKLGQIHRRVPCSERTLGRWLGRLKLVRTRTRRLYHSLTVAAKSLSVGYAPNEVWTVDFKGKFWTADGQRADPLTVRDLYSRFGLCVALVKRINDQEVRRVFRRLFSKFGLPRVIRVDNGTPFAGQGPYGYSSLSLWWTRLGIKVEFTRRATPSDNGSHEQFHRIYKDETTKPPAPSLLEQQKRSDQWLMEYNTQRPHEALGGKCPIQLYTKSRRRYRSVARNYAYPKHCKVLQVDQWGYVKWKGHKRRISRVAAGLRVALKPMNAQVVHVCADKILLGTLQVEGRCAMRATRHVMSTM